MNTCDDINFDNIHSMFIQNILADEIKLIVSYPKEVAFDYYHILQKRCFLIDHIEEKPIEKKIFNHFDLSVFKKNGKINLDTMKKSLSTMTIDDYKSQTEEITFMKQWKNLKPPHKLKKIKEYINELDYDDGFDPEKIEKNRRALYNKMVTFMNEKKVGKKNIITYDSAKMKITSINFICKRKDGSYTIREKN